MVTAVGSGTSFGECLVDCDEKVVATPASLTYALSSPLPDDDHPDIEVSMPIAPAQWSSVVDVLDVDRFFAMPPRLGDPDAGDAGAEWIEVSLEDRSHRIEFELGGTIPQMADLVSRLRELRSEVARRHGRKRR